MKLYLRIYHKSHLDRWSPIIYSTSILYRIAQKYEYAEFGQVLDNFKSLELSENKINILEPVLDKHKLQPDYFLVGLGSRILVYTFKRE